MAYSAVTQPEPAVLAPPRNAGRGARGAEHPGPPELDQRRSGGVVEPAPADGDRAEFVGGSGRLLESCPRPYPGGGSTPRSGAKRLDVVALAGRREQERAMVVRACLGQHLLRRVPRRNVRDHEASDAGRLGGLGRMPPGQVNVLAGCRRRPRTTPRRAAGRSPWRARRRPRTRPCRRSRRSTGRRARSAARMPARGGRPEPPTP